jgi:hypothetical protein
MPIPISNHWGNSPNQSDIRTPRNSIRSPRNAVSRAIRSPSRRTRSRRTRSFRSPLGQPVMNRTILRLRTENLPPLPPINTDDRIHERRDFLPRSRGSRYRGRDRTLNDYRVRTLRKRGLYPQADFRNVSYPTKFTGRPTSVERKSRRLSPVEATPIYKPVNNSDLFERWRNYKRMHGFRNSIV